MLLSPPTRRMKSWFVAVASCVAFCLLSKASSATSPEQVYQQKCARCHGPQGEGVAEAYDGPLYGNDSLAALTERIETTMPEDDPESCVGDEARQLAEFIYHQFYSREARIANGLLEAPRVELSRLTVPQHRQAIADLLGQFTPNPYYAADEQSVSADTPGLRGLYFESEKMSKTKEFKFSRVDTALDFDFGSTGPKENVAADQFAIIWEGSLYAPDTGTYEFRIHTPNGVRFYVNADEKERHAFLRDDSSEAIQARLIDAWVSSGKMQTPTARLFLLGGRRYPVRVEYFKYMDPSASIRLEWKTPHDVWRLLDENNLSTHRSQRTFVVETPFPADDRSLGYERGTSVSPEWHTAVAEAALATAEEVVGRLPLLSRVRNADKNQVRLAQFVSRLATTAFRRPLQPAEEQLFGEVLFRDTPPEIAVRRAVLMMLTSPQFLYTNLETAELQSPANLIANRLSWALCDSLPDVELRRLADLNRLSQPAQIAAQIDRLLNDPRAHFKLRGFIRHWLEIEQRDLAKDQQLYPEFDENVVADLRRSLELFVDRVVWSANSDYRELLQADYLLLNPRLRKLYNTALADEAEDRFEPITISGEARAGILTHPYMLSAFAYHNNTSPIHRGVFLTRNVVGRQLKPPPVAVSFENSQFEPHLTMREKVTQLTSDRACQSCHEVINSLGFALENFDAVGRWRTAENDRPIDTYSDYPASEDTTLPIRNARDIADFAVRSPQAHRAFVTSLFKHLAKQNPDAYGEQVIAELSEQFVADEFHIRKLIARIALCIATHDLEFATPAEL